MTDLTHLTDEEIKRIGRMFAEVTHTVVKRNLDNSINKTFSLDTESMRDADLMSPEALQAICELAVGYRAKLAAAQAKLDAIDGLAEKWLLQEQFPSKTGYGEGAYKCATDLQRITNKEKA